MGAPRWLWGVALVAGLGGAFGVGWWAARRGSLMSAPGVLAWHREAAGRVPASAAIVATTDPRWLVDVALLENGGLFPAVDPEGARKRLGDLSRELLGVDLLQSRALVAWGSFDPDSGGVLLDGDFAGTLRGEAGGKAPFGDATMARTPKGLVIGDPDGVEAALSASGAKAHAAVLDALHSDGPLIVTADFAAFPADEVTAGLQAFAVVARADGAAEIVVTGSPEAVSRLAGLLESGKATARTMLEGQAASLRTKATAEPGASWEALGAAILVEKVADVFAVARLVVDGGVARLEAPAPAGVLLVELGGLGAFAGMAFTRSMRQVEALERSQRDAEALRERVAAPAP